jgi:hypothetical protein
VPQAHKEQQVPQAHKEHRVPLVQQVQVHKV